MKPCELKRDIKGILYSDDKYDISNRLLSLDNRNDKDDRSQSVFYSLETTSDYIIKRPVIDLGRKERNAYMDMLVPLLQKQNKITHTEFPIGYYREKRKLAGLIIRYYPNGISLDQIINEKNLSLLKKYYSHSEDNVQNLFMLLDEYLDCLFELYKNDIYYLDVILNNIVLDNNQVRIIDFDPKRVGVGFIDYRTGSIIFNRYTDLVGEILTNYNLSNGSVAAELALSHFTVDGYDEAKRLIEKIRKKVLSNINR